MKEEQRSKAGAPDTFGPRIIIADDHEWIRRILVEIVRQTLPSAVIVDTEDGLQALKAFEDGSCQFLISNHLMPKMDGMSLIRAVRQISPQMPILMVSVKPEASADAMDAGANWFLSKDKIMEHLPPLLLRYAREGAVNPSTAA